MPNDNSILFWQEIGKIYGNNPTVLFGLYNEPHDVSWDVWQNGGDVTDGDITYHTPGFQKIIEAIRDTGAKIFVPLAGWNGVMI